jgi:hypothetical protein
MRPPLFVRPLSSGQVAGAGGALSTDSCSGRADALPNHPHVAPGLEASSDCRDCPGAPGHGPSDDPTLQYRWPGGIARPSPLGPPTHHHPGLDPVAAQARGARPSARRRASDRLDRASPVRLFRRADRHSGCIPNRCGGICASMATCRAEALLTGAPPRADVYVEDETELALVPADAVLDTARTPTQNSRPMGVERTSAGGWSSGHRASCAPTSGVALMRY